MERSTIHLLAKRGKSRRQIARELGLSRKTVARALREPVDKQPAKRVRRSIVDPHEEQIRQWLRQGLTGVRMLELARADPEQPYRGGRSVFVGRVCRLRRELEQSLADVAVRFEGLPGEYLQVDWGEVRRFPFREEGLRIPVKSSTDSDSDHPLGNDSSAGEMIMASSGRHGQW